MKRGFAARAVAVMAAVLSATNVVAQIPRDYYSSLTGKKGADLKTALHEIIRNADVLEYGSGSNNTWWGFYLTDNQDGYVVDRYSNEQRRFGNRGSSVSGMNIEHSFPKSWWGGSKTQAYKDLFNLMPSDTKANSAKLNYGMGEVTSTPTFENGSIKVGTGIGGYKLWEPDEKWKGDFARDYMYMVTAYQDYTWSDNDAKNSLTTGAWPTLKEWAYKLYLSWAMDDEVDQIEVKRNNDVYSIQGNRNPYVDFPNLMEYVWGDSIDVAFNPETTKRSDKWADGGGTVVESRIYSANFHAYDGGCTVANATAPTADTDVWTRNNKYGWVATGAIKVNASDQSPTKFASEGTLTTPEIDLTGMATASFNFSHTARYCSPLESYLSVKVLCGEEEHAVTGITWPSGTNWTFVSSGSISLDEYVGKKVKLAFTYRSTTSTAGTWEIENLYVTGTKVPASIAGVAARQGFDPSRPYTVYGTDGRVVPTTDRSHGIVIVRQDGHTYKVAR